MAHDGSPVYGLLLLLVGIVLYFAPALTAVYREHRNTTAIFALNLLAGWTFVGWVIALVWSLTASPDGQESPPP
jgi:uncharacterized membrane protein HdeD (DUF308 family)